MKDVGVIWMVPMNIWNCFYIELETLIYYDIHDISAKKNDWID